MSVGAVITAAGRSSRMGDFKPMLSLGSISIAQRIIATLKQAGAELCVVVTGNRAEELERHLSQSGVIFVRNERFEETEMFDSARLGLRFMADKCDRLLFTPVDIPLFTPATVTALLASGAPLAYPVCDGERGHPVLMSSEVVRAVIEDGGEGGLRGALSRCGVEETEIEVPDRGVLLDADTPEDYRALVEFHNRQLVRPVVELSLAGEGEIVKARTAMLLLLIQDTGSVRAACERIGISYSQSWKLINIAEDALGFALVERSQGGAKGGAARLTRRGEELLRRYRALKSELRESADELFARHFGDFFE